MTSFAIALPQTVEDGCFDPPPCGVPRPRRGARLRRARGRTSRCSATLPVLAPLEVLAFAAACTERIRLGCAVLISSLHSPVHLAKSLGSLDQLSAGGWSRLGGGGGFRVFAAFGVDPSTFIARFNEGLA